MVYPYHFLVTFLYCCYNTMNIPKFTEILDSLELLGFIEKKEFHSKKWIQGFWIKIPSLKMVSRILERKYSKKFKWNQIVVFVGFPTSPRPHHLDWHPRFFHWRKRFQKIGNGSEITYPLVRRSRISIRKH